MPGKQYNVMLHRGKWFCTCEHASLWPKLENCSHIREAKNKK
jgi:hypothetical protein